MRPALAALLLALAWSAGAADAPASWRLWLEQPAATKSPPAAALPSKSTLDALRGERAVLDRWAGTPPSIAWNDIVGNLVVKYQQNPLRASRAFTYTHTAIHDALVLCAQRGCAPEVRPVAMHAAAGRVLAHIYPDESPGRFMAMSHAAVAATLASGGGHPQAELAWQTGTAVAENAIRRALDDGWDMPKLTPKRPAWKPGVWQAAPPMNIYDPTEPHAPQWRTWVLKSADEIEPPPPLQYDSPAFWAEVEEVRSVAAALTPAQKKIAEDWNLDAGSVTPPGVWNQHAKRLALEHKLDAPSAARMFSTANTAMLDAFISCWHTKYKWWTERPLTVIRRQRDANFMSHVLTPPFPSYTSGHSSVSGAASEVLAAFFPKDAAEMRRMAQEASMSRLYGGIHFRSDNEEGLGVGRKVAVRALARIADDSIAQRATITR
jgi:hypothetical protein